jgi:protein-arginine kinase activator protein McsA
MIADTAAKYGFTDVLFANDLKEAVNMAATEAETGEAVLLSPACASWGMFDNYEQRGDLFKEYVADAAKVALASAGEVCDMKTFNCPKCGKTFETQFCTQYFCCNDCLKLCPKAESIIFKMRNCMIKHSHHIT